MIIVWLGHISPPFLLLAFIAGGGKGLLLAGTIDITTSRLISGRSWDHASSLTHCPFTACRVRPVLRSSTCLRARHLEFRPGLSRPNEIHTITFALIKLRVPPPEPHRSNSST